MLFLDDQLKPPSVKSLKKNGKPVRFVVWSGTYDAHDYGIHTALPDSSETDPVCLPGDIVRFAPVGDKANGFSDAFIAIPDMSRGDYRFDAIYSASVTTNVDILVVGVRRRVYGSGCCIEPFWVQQVLIPPTRTRGISFQEFIL